MAEGFDGEINQINVNENVDEIDLNENEIDLNINEVLRLRLYDESDKCTRHKNNLRSIRTDIRILQAQVADETKLLKEKEKKCLAILNTIDDTQENKQYLIDECNLRQPYEAQRILEGLIQLWQERQFRKIS